jgi:hypothetical protein
LDPEQWQRALGDILFNFCQIDEEENFTPGQMQHSWENGIKSSSMSMS